MTSSHPLVDAGIERSRTAAGRGFRSDIQSLRAIAIAAVVLNHLWPTRFTGGYVGVDVFFVISGFLITGHLLGEVARTGRIRLGRFYARRIRRLLPAALVVLSVTAGLVAAFLPYTRWNRNSLEIIASATYVENWVLSSMSVNYSAMNDAASAVQHFWSLSVEEQFYVLWPATLLLAIFITSARNKRSTPVRSMLIVITGVLVVSFVLSVLYTVSSPAQAYFVTFTRAWEFAVGGVLAVVASRVPLRRVNANVLALLGFIAIVLSVALYGSGTPFPGSAALLPVLGTAAVILAGTNHERLWHFRVTGSAPVQWLGAVSYSLYLWHWPLIVVAPFALQRELSGSTRLAVLVLAILLAWLTKKLVEDRARTWTYWVTSTRRSMALMLAGMLVVAGLAVGLTTGANLRAQTESPEIPPVAGTCVGPSALSDGQHCDDPFGPADSVVMTERNQYYYSPPECEPEAERTREGVELKNVVCDFSQTGEPATDVWIVGDSHAQQWQAAVFDLARSRGWTVTTAYRGGCPAADVAFVGFRTPAAPSDVADCRDWSQAVSAAIVDARPDILFTGMAARLQLVDDGSGRSMSDQFVDGLLRDWRRWSASGARVFAFADPPFNAEVRDADCVVLNARDPLACARPRTLAQPEDPIVTAGARASRDVATVIDLTDRFCDAEQCYAVVGGVPVYFDADHLNRQYVQLLAPEVAAVLDVR